MRHSRISKRFRRKGLKETGVVPAFSKSPVFELVSRTAFSRIVKNYLSNEIGILKLTIELKRLFPQAGIRARFGLKRKINDLKIVNLNLLDQAIEDIWKSTLNTPGFRGSNGKKSPYSSRLTDKTFE